MIANKQAFDLSTAGDFFLHLLYALRFDLSAIVTINILYISLYLLPFSWTNLPTFKKGLHFLFLVTNIIPLLFDLADIGYFPYVRRRMGIEVFSMIGRKSDFIDLLPAYIREFWYVSILVIIVPILFILLNQYISSRKEKSNVKLSSIDWLLWLGSLAFSILLIRGGVQLKPITTHTALLYTSSKNAVLIYSTPFSIIHSVELGKPIQSYHFTENSAALQKIPLLKNYPIPAFTQAPKNVVIIVLESFGKSYTGAGGRVSYTPFLDSLMQKSMVCSRAFANGHTSAMGIPAIFSGIPAFMNADFISSPYANNQIDALPGLLAKRGFTTSFFHGGTNGTMGFDVFAHHAGFDFYFGRTEYANDHDFDGTWGIWDEPYLQYVQNTLSATKEPFMAGVFTLSSHEPFSLPDNFSDLTIKDLRSIYRGVRYTDQALKKFFASASQTKWFSHTLFVITADHNFLVCQDKLGYYNNKIGLYAIPLIYYYPAAIPPSVNHTLTQQLDIMPTVMHFLGMPDTFFAYGNSIFDTSVNRTWYAYLDGLNSFQFNQWATQTHDSVTHLVYNTMSDSLLNSPILNDSIKTQVNNYYQAYIQLLHQTLLQNASSRQTFNQLK